MVRHELVSRYVGGAQHRSVAEAFLLHCNISLLLRRHTCYVAYGKHWAHHLCVDRVVRILINWAIVVLKSSLFWFVENDEIIKESFASVDDRTTWWNGWTLLIVVQSCSCCHRRHIVAILFWRRVGIVECIDNVTALAYSWIDPAAVDVDLGQQNLLLVLLILLGEADVFVAAVGEVEGVVLMNVGGPHRRMRGFLGVSYHNTLRKWNVDLGLMVLVLVGLCSNSGSVILQSHRWIEVEGLNVVPYRQRLLYRTDFRIVVGSHPPQKNRLILLRNWAIDLLVVNIWL